MVWIADDLITILAACSPSRNNWNPSRNFEKQLKTEMRRRGGERVIKSNKFTFQKPAKNNQNYAQYEQSNLSQKTNACRRAPACAMRMAPSVDNFCFNYGNKAPKKCAFQNKRQMVPFRRAKGSSRGRRIFLLFSFGFISNRNYGNSFPFVGDIRFDLYKWGKFMRIATMQIDLLRVCMGSSEGWMFSFRMWIKEFVQTVWWNCFRNISFDSFLNEVSFSFN